MGRVPRVVLETDPVVMPKLRAALSIGSARPVRTSVVLIVRERPTIGRGAGQNVMLVWLVELTVNDFAIFVQGMKRVQPVAAACELQCITVKMRKIPRNQCPIRVVPRTIADPVARIDRVRTLSAQIRAPCGLATSRGTGQRFAVSIRPCKAAEVSPIAQADAGHKKAHRLWLILLREG